MFATPAALSESLFEQPLKRRAYAGCGAGKAVGTDHCVWSRGRETEHDASGERRPRRVYADETPPSVILLSPFSVPFKDHSGAWRNETSFGLNDLNALVNVAREAKEWISAHTLKR